jgi:hypothetical protein
MVTTTTSSSSSSYRSASASTSNAMKRSWSLAVVVHAAEGLVDVTSFGTQVLLSVIL